MKRTYFYFYALMVVLNLLPFISMSIKGILGLVFIIISCLRINGFHGKITATLWVVMGYMNFGLGINVDYKNGFITMLLGSSLYYLTAFYFGNFTDTLNRKNKELKEEIERRKNVEKELRENLTLLKSLMDTIPSPIFFKDLNRKYIGCNHAFETSIGVSQLEIKEKTPHEITDTELADIYEKMDLELFEKLGTQTYEGIVKFSDGSLRNIIFNKAIFNDEAGNPAGIVGVMTDISERKETEKLKQSIVEKKQIIDEILEQDKMKTEFFSNISHELRTPLNVILGSVQLMELYFRDNQYHSSKEKIVKNTATMKQNCFRLLRLVNNLIDISKIDAKAFEIHLKNCNIVSVIEEITLSVSEYIENKGIRLVFDTDIEEKIMACDEEKIERIMLNLLSNAIKFTPKDGEILVNVNDREDGLSILIKDNGIGIPMDKQDKIFQRFCQIDSMFTRQHEGSGIGLNLVKSLVDMHGGNISFESDTGKGTSFHIFLPYKKACIEQIEFASVYRQAHVERINVEFSDIYSIFPLEKNM